MVHIHNICNKKKFPKLKQYEADESGRRRVLLGQYGIYWDIQGFGAKILKFCHSVDAEPSVPSSRLIRSRRFHPNIYRALLRGRASYDARMILLGNPQWRCNFFPSWCELFIDVEIWNFHFPSSRQHCIFCFSVAKFHHISFECRVWFRIFFKPMRNADVFRPNTTQF